MTFSRRRSQNNVLKTTFSRRRFNAMLCDNAILNDNAILSDNANQLICFIKFFNQSSRELTILIHKNLDFLCRFCVVSVPSLCRLCVVSVSSLCRHCVVIVSSQCHLIVVSVSSLSFLCRLENVVSRTSSRERRLKNVVSNRTSFQTSFRERICKIYM
jgi:hypothetical protein